MLYEKLQECFRFLNEAEIKYIKFRWVSLCGVVANVLYCDIVVSEFELQSHANVHFLIDILGKGMNLLMPPVICWIVSLLFFFKDDFGIK